MSQRVEQGAKSKQGNTLREKSNQINWEGEMEGKEVRKEQVIKEKHKERERKGEKYERK